MPETETYRGNKLKVKSTNGKHALQINGKEIAVFGRDELQQGVNTDYNFLPASDILELGQRIVDEQLSLVNPRLSGLKDK